MSKLLLLFLALPTLTYALPPLNVQIQYECPEVRIDPNDPNEPLLKNDGSAITGGGDITVNSRKMDPYHADYLGVSQGSNIPLDLASNGYNRAGAAYLSLPGIIKCHYVSSMHFDAFDVFHLINNGQGGVVYATTPAFIGVKFRIG